MDQEIFALSRAEREIQAVKTSVMWAYGSSTWKGYVKRLDAQLERTLAFIDGVAVGVKP